MTNICKKCGADNEVGATECTQCGAKLRAMPPMPGVADAAALGSMANPSAPSAAISESPGAEETRVATRYLRVCLAFCLMAFLLLIR